MRIGELAHPDPLVVVSVLTVWGLRACYGVPASELDEAVTDLANRIGVERITAALPDGRLRRWRVRLVDEGTDRDTPC